MSLNSVKAFEQLTSFIKLSSHWCSEYRSQYLQIQKTVRVVFVVCLLLKSRLTLEGIKQFFVAVEREQPPGII